MILHLLAEVLPGLWIGEVQAVLVNQHGLLLDPVLQACLETDNQSFLPISPGTGGKSRPSASFPSLMH